MPDDDFDLMAVEVPSSILDRVLASMPSAIETSQVLEESRIGVENLPVIGSPVHSPQSVDLETPRVERRPLVEEREEMEVSTPSPPPDPPALSSSDRTSSRASEDTGYHDESEGIKEKKETKRTIEKKKKMEKVVAKPVEERPKKERAPLVATPSAPKFPVKPKAPSKHQLMMEKLKASIEAEKNAPKKAAKTRMSLLPQAPTNETSDENGMGISSRVPSDKSKTPLSSRQPSSLCNGPSTTTKKASGSSRPATSSVAMKREEKGKEGGVRGLARNANTTTRTVPSSKPSSSSSSFPTSSFAPKVGQPKNVNGAVVNSARKRNTTKETVDEQTKIRRLKDATNCALALAVTLQLVQEEKRRTEEMLVKEYDDKVSSQTRVDHLLAALADMEKTKREEMEELHQANEKTIKAVRNELLKQSEAREVAHCQLIEEEKGRHEGEVAELVRRHQKTCALLDEKNAEAERMIEQIQSEKKTLHNALATDHDTKVQTLSQEISSLNTALQLKSTEMKELRLKNQHLIMRVDEIPAKDLEITKLRHKIVELKLQLDQKHEREKLLIQQNDELRRRERNSTALSESYNKQLDLLKFRLGLSEDEEQNGDLESSAYFSSPTVRMRNGGESAERPYSYTLPSSARTPHRSSESDEMLSRSVMGMFSANRNTAKVSALDEDVIYAPDAIITSGQRKLCFAEDDSPITAESPITSVSVCGPSDSGIGI